MSCQYNPDTFVTPYSHQRSIIWHKVPQEAIVHTFDVRDLATLCNRNTAVAEVLRPEIIASERRSLKTTVVVELQEGDVSLTPRTVTALAHFCRFAGLNGRSALKHLEHLVGLKILRTISFQS